MDTTCDCPNRQVACLETVLARNALGLVNLDCCWVSSTLILSSGMILTFSMLIGGTISDVEGNPPGRNGHWDKHGKWHDDRWGYASSLLGGKAVADEQVTITQ